MRTISQTPSLAERLAALEKAAGIKPPAEVITKPVPPMAHMGTMQRTTQLISTEQGRAVRDRRAARAAAMASHAQTTRFFAGPTEPANVRVPRASRTGSAV